jgi:hypothetical protein
MKYLLFFCALLASCARPPVAQPPHSEPIGADALTPNDSLAQVPIDFKMHAADSGSTPQEALRRRVFGLLPPKKVASSPQNVASDNLTGYKLPRKCKGCTFNLVTGNQTNSTAGKKATLAAGDGATASVVGKKAGPAIVASDSSTLNAIEGGGNLAAVHGDGNQLTQTKADIEPPGIGATIAKAIAGPTGIMLAVGLSIGAIYLLVLWRKKKAVENLV